MKKTSGLTLMELTIVMAILVIIAAILVPLFLLSTDRARLRGDIASAHVIQNAMELYIVERGHSSVMNGDDVNAIVTRLAAEGYLNPRNVQIQTRGEGWAATWVRQNHSTYGYVIMVDIGGVNVPDAIHQAFASLPANEQQFVSRGDEDR